MEKIVSKTLFYSVDVYFSMEFYQHETPAVLIKYHCTSCKKKTNKKILYHEYKDQTSQEYHDKFCSLCGSVWQTYQDQSQVRSVQKLIFDNGDVMFLLQISTPRAIDAQPMVSQYKVRIPINGVMNITKNNKKIFNIRDIESILTQIKNHFKEAPSLLEYFVSRNSRLKDFSKYMNDDISEFFLTLDVNTRRRLYYAYDKHGVKAAYRKLLDNKGNKFLNALVWKNLYLVTLLKELLTCFTTDQLSNILSLIQVDIGINDLNKIRNLVSIGYSPLKIKNLVLKEEYYNTSSWLFLDISRLFANIQRKSNGNYLLPKHSSLSELHDILTRDYNQIKDTEAQFVKLPVSNLIEFHTDDYSIKLTKTAEDLNKIGRDLKICVGSYKDIVLNGSCVIAYITKNDQNLGCLQVNSKTGTLVQAKLHRNAPVNSDVEIERLVYLWAKVNDISVNTHDLDFYHKGSKQIDLVFQNNVKVVSDGSDMPF